MLNITLLVKEEDVTSKLPTQKVLVGYHFKGGKQSEVYNYYIGNNDDHELQTCDEKQGYLWAWAAMGGICSMNEKLGDTASFLKRNGIPFELNCKVA